MLNKKKNNKGFTLVELLVVIAIIGILAVVAVPALFKNINKAKVADVESDYSAIKSASLSYYADKNTVPDNTNALEGYMDSVPTKSAFGGSYSLEKKPAMTGKESKLVLKITDPKITTEQLKKLVGDVGDGKVYSGDDFTGSTLLTVNNINNNINVSNLFLVIIDNTDM